MHILVTNDDGPPSQQSSPYVHSLIDTLQKAGHVVSVILPETQKSWIGKAHLVGQTMTPKYFRPGTLHTDDGQVFERPSQDGTEDWILVNGTPAGCVQVGLHHFFKEKGPIDLVLSGPNYGRNTTAIFSLSSGTIGGAMEGSICGKKAIAISYAFDSRNHDPEIIKEASERSIQVIEHLYKTWPADVDLFSINVPLRKGTATCKVVYADILQNKWGSTGNSYDEVSVDEENASEHEQTIRETGEAGAGKPHTTLVHRHFKWNPKFKDVYDSVDKGGEGSDGWIVKEGMISVTPLKANFWHVSGLNGEIKLDASQQNTSVENSNSPQLQALIDYPDPYVQPLVLNAVKKHLSDFSIKFLPGEATIPAGSEKTLQIRSYETLDFHHANLNPATSLINAYIIRKAMIRKHYLSNGIANWVVKHPDSILKKHVKDANDFELDYAEYLDEATQECYELLASLEENATKEDKDKQWWILKPGMSDGGNGICLFSSFEELQEIFEQWEVDEEDETAADDDEATNDQEVGKASTDQQDKEEESAELMISQLRHFVVQPYIHPPLLLPSKGNRKFHIRAYVLAVGSLKVYVYREMLALFAARPYCPPTASSERSFLASHLTNTCFQDDSTKDESVFRFWSLEDDSISDSKWKESVYEQICQVTGEVFEAAARGQMVHFQTLPNSFELFGVDFLIDESLNAWLLELNAFPDFSQTGADLKDVVIGGLFDETVRLAVRPFFDEAKPMENTDRDSRMKLVLDVDLGRR